MAPKNKKKGKAAKGVEKSAGEQVKEQADKAFDSESFDKAFELYSEAIGLLEQDGVESDGERLAKLYSNRSVTLLKLKQFDRAVEDAEKTISLLPGWSRGYYRKGQALEAIMRYEDAFKVYEAGLKVEETDALHAAYDAVKGLIEDIEQMQKKISSEVNPDHDKYEVMLKWLIQGGAKFPKLYMEYYSEDYRGVHSLSKIVNDEIILEVPLNMIMSSDIAKDSEIGKKIIDSKVELLSSHSYLASYLLQEKHKENSFWKPFMDILPVSYRNMPIFFDEEEKSYLKGSFSLRKMADRVDSLTREYNNLCEAVPEFKKFTYDEFVWARMVVITRIFGFYINGRKTDGLVPMADMLNHKHPNDKDVKWAFDDSRNGFIMTSIKIIPKGTQIYDSYGRKCNHRFFVNYGFSLEENDDNESVFIVQVNPEDPQVRMKANLLHAAGLGLVKEFQIPANTKHAKTKACLAFLRLAMSSGSEMILLPSGEELKKRIEASEDDAGLDIIQPLSATNEKAVLKAMKAAAQACLARFETTIEEDNKLLAEGNLTFNIRNAVLMRRGEKQVAQYFIELADEMLELFDMDWKDFKKYATKCQQGKGRFDNYVLSVVLPLVKASH